MIELEAWGAHEALILTAPTGTNAAVHPHPSSVCLSELLNRVQPNTILLVRGNASYSTGPSSPEQIVEPQIYAYLEHRGLSTDHLIQISGFYNYPTEEDVQRTISLIRTHNVDLIIGIGGGMPMDIAKAAAILAGQAGDPSVYITGGDVPQDRATRLVLIPTTAGSGAEVTPFAVVYLGGVKYSLAHPSMGADYTLLMPELTHSLPKNVTAAAGCDAIAQAIEAHWSVNATPESVRYSERALKLLLPHIVDAVRNPTGDVRRAMLTGACYAGMAIKTARTTWAHAASYWMTANRGISHGHAVMLTLPWLFPLIDQVDEQTLQQAEGLTLPLLRAKMISLYNLLEVNNGLEARDKLHGIMDACGLERSLARLNITPADFEHIVDAVNPERMKNMPMTISRDTALDLLHQASGR